MSTINEMFYCHLYEKIFCFYNIITHILVQNHLQLQLEAIFINARLANTKVKQYESTLLVNRFEKQPNLDLINYFKLKSIHTVNLAS